MNELRATSEIRLNNYGATSSSDLDDKMEESYRRLNILYNKYLHDTDCKPSEAKERIIGDLNNSISKCLDIKISNIGNIGASQGTLYFSKIDHPNEFEFNVLSSGEKEVVDLLLDLYLRREEYNDTIFLLDEPELHINTSIQKNLLLEIDSLVGENCQIWITTHSIGFLRTLQEELKNKCQVIKFNDALNLASEAHILKRWEIENYLYDKEVLRKYCFENTLVFNENDYDAFVKDIDNQNLKDATGRIKNYCNIIVSINSEKFKLSLSEYISEDMHVYKLLEKCIFDRN